MNRRSNEGRSRRTSPVSLLSLTLVVLSMSACKPAQTTQPGPHDDHHAAAPAPALVDNWLAQPGDTTICPSSGDTFEVTADSVHFSYQGYRFVFCCEPCLEAVQADPGKYLDALVERAGGPASDPDHVQGGAIDDSE